MSQRRPCILLMYNNILSSFIDFALYVFRRYVIIFGRCIVLLLGATILNAIHKWVHIR